MPFGAAVRAHANAQICNGLAAQMVLYQYDFCDAAAADSQRLNYRGSLRLREIVRMLPATQFHPIIIETTPENPALDAARRASVLQALNQMNIPLPESLIVVGKPAVPALRGVDAVEVNRNLIRQTRVGGISPITSMGSGSNSSGSGSYGSLMNTSPNQ